MNFSKGDFVKSHYNAQWKGIVLDIVKRKNCGDLLAILILLSATGKPVRKRMVKYYDEYWMKVCEPFDISGFNKVWFEHVKEE